MKHRDRRVVLLGLGLACVAVLACGAMPTNAYAQPAAGEGAPPELPLFAVEFRTGPAWDASKPPQEQAQFREHSANLKKLRDEGRIRIGARYADKGLIVLAAESREQARAWIEADPAVKAGVFVFELHDFRVFYPGSVAAPRR